MYSLNQNSNLNLLNKENTLLKNEIQNIINKIEKLNNEEDKKELSELKQEKINKLNININLIKEYKQSKEFNKICSINDNKENSDDKKKEIKKNRENANNEYNLLKDIEKEYMEKDLENLPAFIFFEKDILDKYKLCPFIKFEDFDTKETMYEKRLNWLNKQQDSGKLYFNLYNNICCHSVENKLKEEIEKLEDFFHEVHENIFTKQQIETYNNILLFIDEWNNCKIKTKRIKEKFKIIINQLSLLIKETGLNIDKFLFEKYNLLIPVNNISDNNNDYFLYDEKVEEYNILKTKLKTNIKYVKNMTMNLKEMLFKYLYKNNNINNEIQTGKYFKKWTQLLNQEKLDRIESFSKFYIYKLKKEANDMEIDLDTLNLLLKNNIKNLIVKWNIKLGIITCISNLKYKLNSNKIEFYIEEKKIKEKKKSSFKTILNSSNQKIINEILLNFILNNKTHNEIDFIEHVKEKLRLKRILKNDKNELLEKFNETLKIINFSNNLTVPIVKT